MADEAPAAAAPKKKKGKKLILLVGLLVLVGGGIGGGVFLATSGMLGGKASAETAKDADKPQLVAMGAKKAAKEGEGAGGGHASAEGGEGGPKYDSTYFKMEKEFTSNLNDSVHLLQVGLAVSTNYDERVIEHLQAHELAVRSAVLMTLSETDEEQVFTSAGKVDLQKRLAKAINQTLKQKTGFGGVGNVYFTNFIVQ